MTELLDKEGYRIVPFEEEAEVYVINTCTVTARTDAESRRLIRRAKKNNPHARVVVTGCFAQVSPGAVAEIPGVDLVIGNSEKREIADFLRREEGGQQVAVSDISVGRKEEALPLESFAEHTRAFLQVQNGCDAFCAYCIVPYARGRSRSVPPEAALQGMSSFTAKGFREVVLTGIHLGAYGLDLDPPSSLLDLLRQAEERFLSPRIRLGSVEPLEVSDGLIDLLASSKVVCPHIHIPLQSGSDAVLSRMGRGYEASLFADLCTRLAAAVPDISIGTDLIAGFPGESEEEFREGYKLLQSLPLAYFHVFPFSLRSGTRAAGMPGQVSPSVIKERAALLRQLSDEKRGAFNAGVVGKELSVLIQRGGEDGTLKGLSRNYLEVLVPGSEALINTEVPVLVTGMRDGVLHGEVLSKG